MTRRSFNRPAQADRLIEAAIDGKIDTLRSALKNASSQEIDARDAEGMTALHHALHHAQESAALLLLHHGAAASLPENTKGTTPLMIACEREMSGVVERLIALGAQIDARETASGDTALMKALRAGHGWAACRLASLGADADLRNHAGETAQTLAAAHLLPRDLPLFEKALEAAREKKNPGVLQRDVCTLRPVHIRHRPPKT